MSEDTTSSEPKPHAGDLSRRDFLKSLAGSAAMFGLRPQQTANDVAKVFYNATNNPVQVPDQIVDPQPIIELPPVVFNTNFQGLNEAGEFVEITGSPRSLKLRDGNKLWIEFTNDQNESIYVNPLAIQSSTFGEHPADRIIRLVRQHNLSPLEFENNDILELMSNIEQRDDYFTKQNVRSNIREEYIEGVVVEMNPLGEQIIKPTTTPEEWVHNRRMRPEFFSIEPRTAGFAEVQLGQRLARPEDFREEREIFEIAKNSWTSYGSAWTAQMLEATGFIDLGVEDIGNFISAAESGTFGHYFVAHSDLSGQLERTNQSRLFTINSEMRILTPLYSSEFSIISHTPDITDPEIDTARKRFLISAEHPENHPRFQTIELHNPVTGTSSSLYFPGESFGGKPELNASTLESVVLPDGEKWFIAGRYGDKVEGGGLWKFQLDEEGNVINPEKLIESDHILKHKYIGTDEQGRRIYIGSEKRVRPTTANSQAFEMTIVFHVLDMQGSNSQVIDLGIVPGWNPFVTLSEDGNTAYVQAAIGALEYFERDARSFYHFPDIKGLYERFSGVRFAV